MENLSDKAWENICGAAAFIVCMVALTLMAYFNRDKQ